MSGDPRSGSKVRETLDREIGEPGENSEKAVSHRDFQPVARFPRPIKSPRPFASPVGCLYVSVFSTERDRSHGILRQIGT